MGYLYYNGSNDLEDRPKKKNEKKWKYQSFNDCVFVKKWHNYLIEFRKL